MGSFSSSKSEASDNRLAVTDQGFGLSTVTSGNRNNVALEGHIFNLGTNSGNGVWGGNGRGAVGNSGGGSVRDGNSNASTSSSDTNINILDGDAINKAFDFAAFSLSETLGSIINSNKQTATQLANAQQYSMDTIGQAINSAATTTSQAAQQAATENSETLKKYAMIGAVGLAAWYFLFKGKK